MDKDVSGLTTWGTIRRQTIRRKVLHPLGRRRPLHRVISDVFLTVPPPMTMAWCAAEGPVAAAVALWPRHDARNRRDDPISAPQGRKEGLIEDGGRLARAEGAHRVQRRLGGVGCLHPRRHQHLPPHRHHHRPADSPFEDDTFVIDIRLPDEQPVNVVERNLLCRPWLLEFVVIELFLANLRIGYHLPASIG